MTLQTMFSIPGSSVRQSSTLFVVIVWLNSKIDFNETVMVTRYFDLMYEAEEFYELWNTSADTALVTTISDHEAILRRVALSKK